ncbi:MAG: hypothetical protein WCI06_04540 [Methylococcaceae bacterium]
MIKKLLLSFFAILVILEEWLWDALAIAGQWFSRVLHLEKFDNWLLSATPNQALLTFLIPLIIATPFNILAVVLLANGAILQGILIEIAVKLFATLLIARIFRLVKLALLTFGWFVKIYNTISSVLHWAHEVIHHTAIYQYSLKLKAAIKIQVAAFLKKYHFSN